MSLPVPSVPSVLPFWARCILISHASTGQSHKKVLGCSQGSNCTKRAPVSGNFNEIRQLSFFENGRTPIRTAQMPGRGLQANKQAAPGSPVKTSLRGMLNQAGMFNLHAELIPVHGIYGASVRTRGRKRRAFPRHADDVRLDSAHCEEGGKGCRLTTKQSAN